MLRNGAMIISECSSLCPDSGLYPGSRSAGASPPQSLHRLTVRFINLKRIYNKSPHKYCDDRAVECNPPPKDRSVSLTIWIRMRWALQDRIRSKASSSEAKNALGSKQPGSPLTAALLTTPPLSVSLRRPLFSQGASTTGTLV